MKKVKVHTSWVKVNRLKPLLRRNLLIGFAWRVIVNIFKVTMTFHTMQRTDTKLKYHNKVLLNMITSDMVYSQTVIISNGILYIHMQA